MIRGSITVVAATAPSRKPKSLRFRFRFIAMVFLPYVCVGNGIKLLSPMNRQVGYTLSARVCFHGRWHINVPIMEQ